MSVWRGLLMRLNIPEMFPPAQEWLTFFWKIISFLALVRWCARTGSPWDDYYAVRNRCSLPRRANQLASA
jgi:hypothetical protein